MYNMNKLGINKQGVLIFIVRHGWTRFFSLARAAWRINNDNMWKNKPALFMLVARSFLYGAAAAACGENGSNARCGGSKPMALLIAMALYEQNK